MSLEAMLDLGLFNCATTAAMESCQILADGSTASSSHPSVMSGERCSCPARTMPKRPDKLPFPAIPENNEKMEVWLKEYFASSTFNVCPAKELPEMSGPPVEIHLKDGAVPYKAQTAVSIPLHWQTPVKEQYARDIKVVFLSIPQQMKTTIGVLGRCTVPNLMKILAEQLTTDH